MRDFAKFFWRSIWLELSMLERIFLGFFPVVSGAAYFTALSSLEKVLIFIGTILLVAIYIFGKKAFQADRKAQSSVEFGKVKLDDNSSQYCAAYYIDAVNVCGESILDCMARIERIENEHKTPVQAHYVGLKTRHGSDGPKAGRFRLDPGQPKHVMLASFDFLPQGGVTVPNSEGTEIKLPHGTYFMQISLAARHAVTHAHLRIYSDATTCKCYVGKMDD
jgi:hypothetical protein